MVRLVGQNWVVFINFNIQFQFLYGAIGGMRCANLRRIVAMISIPIWCDWWTQSTVSGHSAYNISIPIWCDWWEMGQPTTEFNLKEFQFLYGAIGGRFYLQDCG